MGDTFTQKLAHLTGTVCRAVDVVEFETAPSDSIYAVGTRIRFADETVVSAQFWRLINAGRPPVSIFDHRQRYGLPARIDAIGVLSAALVPATLVNASMDHSRALPAPGA